MSNRIETTLIQQVITYSKEYHKLELAERQCSNTILVFRQCKTRIDESDLKSAIQSIVSNKLQIKKAVELLMTKLLHTSNKNYVLPRYILSTQELSEGYVILTSKDAPVLEEDCIEESILLLTGDEKGLIKKLDDELSKRQSFLATIKPAISKDDNIMTIVRLLNKSK